MVDESPTIVDHIGVGTYWNSVESVKVKIIYIYELGDKSIDTHNRLPPRSFHYYDAVFTKTVFFQSQYYDAYCYYSCLLRTRICIGRSGLIKLQWQTTSAALYIAGSGPRAVFTIRDAQKHLQQLQGAHRGLCASDLVVKPANAAFLPRPYLPASRPRSCCRHTPLILVSHI